MRDQSLVTPDCDAPLPVLPPFLSISLLRPLCPSLNVSFPHTSPRLVSPHATLQLSPSQHSSRSAPFPPQLVLSLPAAASFQAQVVPCVLQKHAPLYMSAQPQPLINFWPLLSPLPSPDRNHGSVIRLAVVTRGWRLPGNSVLQLWLHLHGRKILLRQQLPFSPCLHLFSRLFFLFFDVCFLFFFKLFVFRLLLRSQLWKATSLIVIQRSTPWAA